MPQNEQSARKNNIFFETIVVVEVVGVEPTS